MKQRSHPLTIMITVFFLSLFSLIFIINAGCEKQKVTCVYTYYNPDGTVREVEKIEEEGVGCDFCEELDQEFEGWGLDVRCEE